GTRHIMLDQIVWRVRQMCRADAPGDGSSTEAAHIYKVAPVRVHQAARQRGRPWLPGLSRTAGTLAAIPGDVDLTALAEGCVGLETALAGLPAEAWLQQAGAF